MALLEALKVFVLPTTINIDLVQVADPYALDVFNRLKDRTIGFPIPSEDGETKMKMEMETIEAYIDKCDNTSFHWDLGSAFEAAVLKDLDEAWPAGIIVWATKPRETALCDPGMSMSLIPNTDIFLRTSLGGDGVVRFLFCRKSAPLTTRSV